MTLTILSPAPKTGHHPRVHVRCECGREFDTDRHRATSGKVTKCGPCARKRGSSVTPEQRREQIRAARKTREEKVRRPEEMPVLVPVRLIRAHPLMDDAKLVERLVALLNPPFGRLPYAQPVSVAWVCEQIGAEPHHVLRAPLSIALEWDCEGERMWGRRIAAGDVFGSREVNQQQEAA